MLSTNRISSGSCHFAKAAAFAKWQLPDEILFVDNIPLTSTGKMDKKVVRADLESKGYQLPSLRGEATG